MDRIVETEVIKNVIQRIEVPIESVRVETVKQIVEKIVEKEKIVMVGEAEGGDCECLTEVGFVTQWNKMMQIKFADNKLTDECISDARFTELITSNLLKNSK